MRGEEHLHQADQYLAVVLVIDLTSVQVLNEDSSEGIPWNLFNVDVVSVSERIYVFVDEVEGASLVGFVELVHLSPSDWSIPQSFQDNSM